MITSDDTQITEQTDNLTELFDTFIKQRKLRCDLVVRDWHFDFLAVHKEFPKNLPLEYHVWVINLHNPDDISKEFHLTIQKIHELFGDYDIIPLYL